MSAGHRHSLFLEHDSAVHRAAPQIKVATHLLFVLCVVATPREAFWAFGVHALLVFAASRAGRVPVRFLLRRLVIELPFVAFAVLLPFLASGPRMDLVGVSLSRSGLWAAWNILAKGTLGVGATVVLAATTPAPEIIRGLERLRLPRALTATAGFMVRYADVIAAESKRMRIARESRGYDPRWFWQVRALAASAGTLFVRSYERGERVFLAMRSRGFDGRLPNVDTRTAPTTVAWAGALSLPAVAALVALVAWVVR